MKRVILVAFAAVLSLGAGLARGQQQQPPPDRVTVEELKRLIKEGRPVVVLDVRGHAERVIKGARHIPLDQVESRVGELPRGREIITYCA